MPKILLNSEYETPPPHQSPHVTLTATTPGKQERQDITICFGYLLVTVTDMYPCSYIKTITVNVIVYRLLSSFSIMHSG